MRVIGLLMCVGILVSSGGCMTATLITESRETSIVQHRLVEYRDAFILEDAVVLNGRASTSNLSPGKSYISARYRIAAPGDLPDPKPSEVVLNYRRMPRGGRPVPIEYVSLPRDRFPYHDDPRVYEGFTPEDTGPVIVVNTIDPRPLYKPHVNQTHVLYVAPGSGDLRNSVVLDAPTSEKEVSTQASLVLVPFTVLGDIVTFPIQAVLVIFINSIARSLR